MRVEEWVIFVLTLARLLKLPPSIIIHRLMMFGLNEWTVRWTEIQLNICAPRFVKSCMIFTKRKCQVLPVGWNSPSHQCGPGVARRQLSKYLMGRNPEGNRLFSVVPCGRADASGHKTKLLRFLGNIRGDLYCEDKEWARFSREAVWSLHPWRYLKSSPGHVLDAALGVR